MSTSNRSEVHVRHLGLCELISTLIKKFWMDFTFHFEFQNSFSFFLAKIKYRQHGGYVRELPMVMQKNPIFF